MTISSFIHNDLSGSLEDIFNDINGYMFGQLGVDLDHTYIDGTRIEANTNFVALCVLNPIYCTVSYDSKGGAMPSPGGGRWPSEARSDEECGQKFRNYRMISDFCRFTVHAILPHTPSLGGGMAGCGVLISCSTTELRHPSVPLCFLPMTAFFLS